MKGSRIVRMLAIVALGLSTASLWASGSRDEPAAKAALVGTWRLVSYNYGDQGDLKPAPAGMVALKHITPGYFEWVRYDAQTKQATGTAGGRWILAGDSYTETVEYGFGGAYDVVKEQDHSFKITVEGDRLSQKGKLNNGLAINEIWERVK
jgi:hypothetical protein